MTGNNNEELFRKKSLDKVKSPENLDDYIQVSNPGVWLLLISVIVLLAGACFWGIFGHMESTADAEVSVENGEVVCCVDDEDMKSVQVGMTVRFGDFEAVISQINPDDKNCACDLLSEQVSPDGLYEGEVITESITPISFILN